MKEYLNALIRGRDLTRQQTYDVMIGITQEKYNAEQIAALLMAIQLRGASVDELLGFRDALLETGKSIDLSPYDTLDIVGTGGDGKNTFNISTCSAFVIAAAGYKVSKHGNGSATSVSGASDVLLAHGVKFTSEQDQLLRSLEETGICYLHAPLFAYGMKFVGPTRRALQVQTVFNLLGPLINPARPKYNFLGTATIAQMRLYVNTLQRMGVEYGVVSSYDGYDEISLTGEFKITSNTAEKILSASQLGLHHVRPEEIFGGTQQADAISIFDNVLQNKATLAQKEVVIANAAMAINIIEQQKPLEECLDLAREALESGRAWEIFSKFVSLNS